MEQGSGNDGNQSLIHEESTTYMEEFAQGELPASRNIPRID